MKSFRPCEYDLNHGPWDPLSGGTIAVVDLFYDVFKGIGEIGSEFVRVPSVSQNEASNPNEAVHYPARSEVSLNSDDKIVGARAAKGFARMTKAAVRSPMTVTVAMAQGAHNLPKMYGDKTVRPQDKITGVGSGLIAGTKVSGSIRTPGAALVTCSLLCTPSFPHFRLNDFFSATQDFQRLCESCNNFC